MDALTKFRQTTKDEERHRPHECFVAKLLASNTALNTRTVQVLAYNPYASDASDAKGFQNAWIEEENVYYLAFDVCAVFLLYMFSEG